MGNTGRTGEALAEYNKVVQVKPNYVAAWVELAALYFGTQGEEWKDMGKARDCLAKDPADRPDLEGLFEVLEIPQLAVLEHLQQDVEHLGVRLLERTTRRLRVTEAGSQYFEFCDRITSEASKVCARILNY